MFTKNTKIYRLFIGIVIVFFTIGLHDVQASVECDFGDIQEVEYAGGVPTPSGSSCFLSIINDESQPLTITNITIDSHSMEFTHINSDDGSWSCSYTQTSPAPDFAGQTVCTPSSTLILQPGENSGSDNFELVFTYENTSATTHNPPTQLDLSSIVANGVYGTEHNAQLSPTLWNVNVVDSTPPTPPASPGIGNVEGYVYFDDNNNDKRDSGEEGAEDVSIKLQYAGADGKFGTDDDKKYKDKTNKKGKFHFDKLDPGKYKLKIADGEMQDFYLTAEKDKVNGKSNFSLNENETKKRDFGYDRDRDEHGKTKNNNLSYLKSGFTLSVNSIIDYLIALVK